MPASIANSATGSTLPGDRLHAAGLSSDAAAEIRQIVESAADQAYATA